MEGRGLRAVVALLLIAPASQGCVFLRPCDSGTQRVAVKDLAGVIEPGRIASILVPYDQGWSQNDVRVSWPDQRTPGGPLLKVYATSASCADFKPPAEDTVRDAAAPPRARPVEPRTAPQPRNIEDRPCELLSGANGTYRSDGVLVQHGLTVAGGPKQLRPDMHQYMLHVIGDKAVAVEYAIAITRPGCAAR